METRLFLGKRPWEEEGLCLFHRRGCPCPFPGRRPEGHRDGKICQKSGNESTHSPGQQGCV